MSDEEIDALKHRAMGAFKTHLLYSSATEQVRANVIVDLVQALTELQLEATTADRWLTAACDRADAAEAKLATCEKYRDAYVEMDRIGTQAVRDLNAKLAKAVEALREALYFLRPTESDMEKKAGIYRIVTALAEIEGTDAP